MTRNDTEYLMQKPNRRRLEASMSQLTVSKKTQKLQGLWNTLTVPFFLIKVSKNIMLQLVLIAGLFTAGTVVSLSLIVLLSILPFQLLWDKVRRHD